MEPAFTSYQKIPTGTPIPRELLTLRRAVGGQIGELKLGAKTVGPVLKIDDTNYAGRRPDATSKALLELAGVDLHDASTQREAAFLRARYKGNYGR